MATRAQIEANRRNALKSTGPRTAAGKVASSRNARTHGMTASPGDELVAAYFEKIRASRGVCRGSDEDEIRAMSLALRLARAEAAIEQARAGASYVLTMGDDELRFRREIEMILDAFFEDGLAGDPMSPHEWRKGHRLLVKLAIRGSGDARRTYSRNLRYLRAAEARHEEALASWLEELEASTS